MPAAETDVVVTNAALQWVPGHQEMLGRWLAALRPGAWFGMQVPGNFNAPSHTLMRELAATARWRPMLKDVLRGGESVGEPADYLRIMLDAGCTADAWETTYQQVLPGRIRCLSGCAARRCGRCWRFCQPRRDRLLRLNMLRRCGWLTRGRPTARFSPSDGSLP